VSIAIISIFIICCARGAGMDVPEKYGLGEKRKPRLAKGKT
jgi:hypothetical protein